MDVESSFSADSYPAQVQSANRELAAFIAAVTKLYGAEQATLSVEYWLDKAQEMDSPAWLPARNWRAVTITASARLANRLSLGQTRTHATETRRYQGIGDILI
jgi:hypothetical protein